METPNLHALLDEIGPHYRFQAAAVKELLAIEAENAKLRETVEELKAELREGVRDAYAEGEWHCRVELGP